jgi:hypothetical protein
LCDTLLGENCTTKSLATHLSVDKTKNWISVIIRKVRVSIITLQLDYSILNFARHNWINSYVLRRCKKHIGIVNLPKIHLFYFIFESQKKVIWQNQFGCFSGKFFKKCWKLHVKWNESKIYFFNRYIYIYSLLLWLCCCFFFFFFNISRSLMWSWIVNDIHQEKCINMHHFEQQRTTLKMPHEINE